MEQSLDEAGAKPFIKPNANSIAGWRPKQNYVARSADSTLNTFACPFADRCNCRVKFRIFATAFEIKLEAQGEHTSESHVQDKVSKFLTIQQSAALERMVSTNPMVSATSCRRGLELLPDPAVRISPSKQRLVARAIRALFNKKHKAKPPPRTNISHVIMPATSLLDRIDVERKMPAVECLELIQEDVTKFNDMLENPAMFSEIIGLHESFYLLEPMEEKWGAWR